MNASTIPFRTAAGPLVRLRDLLRLLAALRDIRDPFTSSEGLRQSIALLLELAEMVGVPDEWIGRLRAVLDDERLLTVVLAVIQYLLGLASHEMEGDGVRVSMVGGSNEGVVVEQQSLLDWLPITVQLIGLLNLIRGDV